MKGVSKMAEVTLTYKEVDGLLYPNLAVPVEQEVSLTKLGKYGIMAMNYLKESEKIRYKSLYRFGKLAEKMKEVEEEANQLLDQLMEGYLEKHKPNDPNSTMEMWKIREQAKMEAEEIVLHQVVYKFH
uniref:TnpV protein n=1 Tax=[Clostridium] fimetarium TaxID=99656 RepID=UPI002FE678F8